jgi:hypothetical protein
MEPILVGSLLALAGSILPILLKAISAWIHPKLSKSITVSLQSDSLKLDVSNIDAATAAKIIELIDKAERTEDGIKNSNITDQPKKG